MKHEDGYLFIYWIELCDLGIEDRPLLWQISLLMGYVYFYILPYLNTLMHHFIQGYQMNQIFMHYAAKEKGAESPKANYYES